MDNEIVKSNGHDNPSELEETQDAIEQAYAILDGKPRGSISPVTFAKQDMSLMQKILVTSTEEYREETIWRMMNFMDEEEALDHVAAYYEAKELGMDTSFNVAFAFALVATNRKTTQTSLISILLDTLQHGKWATNQTQSRKSNYGSNPRSPIG